MKESARQMVEAELMKVSELLIATQSFSRSNRLDSNRP